jgi:hypothetical protein
MSSKSKKVAARPPAALKAAMPTTTTSHTRSNQQQQRSNSTTKPTTTVVASATTKHTTTATKNTRPIATSDTKASVPPSPPAPSPSPAPSLSTLLPPSTNRHQQPHDTSDRCIRFVTSNCQSQLASTPSIYWDISITLSVLMAVVVFVSSLSGLLIDDDRQLMLQLHTTQSRSWYQLLLDQHASDTTAIDTQLQPSPTSSSSSSSSSTASPAVHNTTVSSSSLSTLPSPCIYQALSIIVLRWVHAMAKGRDLFIFHVYNVCTHSLSRTHDTTIRNICIGIL